MPRPITLPRCTACEYSLSGLDPNAVHTCPECGAPIDWAAAWTPPPRRTELGLAILCGPGVVAFMLGAAWDPSWEYSNVADIALLGCMIVSPVTGMLGLHVMLPKETRLRGVAVVLGAVLGFATMLPGIIAACTPRLR